MTMDEKIALDDLPPSAKLIYYVLKNEGGLTKRQIVIESRLSNQTTRAGLKRLERSNLITKANTDTEEPAYDVSFSSEQHSVFVTPE